MTASSSFDAAMRLTPLSDGVFEGELNHHWTIGPKVHGGVMMALCAKAARTVIGAGEPVAVSANFLRAPDPGVVQVVTSVRKRGRQVSVVDVELNQGERSAVHATVTIAEPEHLVAPLLSVNPVVDLMAPTPPDDVAPIGPGHRMAEINHLAAGCEIRPLLSSFGAGPQGASPETIPGWLRSPPQAGGAPGPPVLQIWVRPRQQAPDPLFALLCGDISAPVTFAVGRYGWAPTVQLTTYLRGLPADGWLRVINTTTQIGQGWFDSDHLVVDCEGRIVVQSRQLALVPTQ